jgi:spermidine synthase
LERSEALYDIILSDLTEPGEEGLSAALFGTEFFRLVERRLRPGGFFALQASCGCPGHCEGHCDIMEALGSVFSVCRSQAIYIESFACLWTFAIASQGPDPRLLRADVIDSRLRSRGLANLRCYDGESHARMFALPRHLRDALARDPVPG